MLDIKAIRQNPDALNEMLQKRGSNDQPAQKIVELDAKLREAQTQAQALQSDRNRLAKEFGMLKKQGADTSDNLKESESIKHTLVLLEDATREYQSQLKTIMDLIPNMILNDVPVGANEEHNQEIRTWGEKRAFDFEPKPHDELGANANMMDFERAANISGARFVALYGPLAKLERALARFMLDTHTQEFGYIEVAPPFMVLEKTLYGTSLLPKFRDDLFALQTGHMLIPTAEVSLTALVMDHIISKDVLPLRLTAYTPCFRAEAGSAGRDTKGMIRQHQFNKVELVSLTSPDQTQAEHERMTNAAETILQRLNLPYRVMLLCSGDMGFQSQKTYDLEVWLPSQNTYREISSCSQCGDFQARRLNARYRDEGGKPALLNSLNGSGLAVGRTLVAVMENYQNSDGSITIPDVLVPYMDGCTRIEPGFRVF